MQLWDNCPLMPFGVGGSMDVAVFGGYLAVIQTGSYPLLNPEHNGRLLIVDPDAPAEERIVGKLDDLGSARQIEISGTIAYITSREDGLFVVDLSEPASPRLLCHYITSEYATGVCAAGNLLVVSLRQHGLELIDVTEPSEPRFVSLARTGEAQSVWIDGHFVYAGVWGSKELVIVDIADPSAPEIACRVPLDGRGDGVCVRDGICYAATGHHSRTEEGMGNGLELFDVRDPYCPVRLSGVKFPKYYGLTFDMWDVQLSGDLALVSDTRNGFFAVDVSDPLRPELLGRILLPAHPDGTRDPIGGFAFSGNRVFLAGAETDLFAAEVPVSLEKSVPAVTDVEAAKPMRPLVLRSEGAAPAWKQYFTGHHVRNAQAEGGYLFLACMKEGAWVLDRDTLERIDVIPAEDSVNTVCYRPPYLYLADGFAGLRILRRENGAWAEAGRYSPYGRAVYDLQFSGDGSRLLLHVASLGALLLRMEAPDRPVWAGEALDYIGLFYDRQFPRNGWRDRCYLSCNRDGTFRLSLSEGALRNVRLEGMPCCVCSEGGLTFAENLLLANKPDRYYLLDPAKEDAPEEHFIPGGQPCPGQPAYRNGLLVLTERADGLITFCDASDLRDIRVLCRAETSASPDAAFIDGDRVYVPGGWQGLLVFENRFGK